jgi:hypothetical protein
MERFRAGDKGSENVFATKVGIMPIIASKGRRDKVGDVPSPRNHYP